MTWQSKKLYLVVFGSLLLAIGILWLLATQVTNSYRAEAKRHQLETENIGIAVEHELRTKLKEAQFIQEIAAGTLLPILSNGKQNEINTAKISEILNIYLARSPAISAIAITNSGNIISSASRENSTISNAFLPITSLKNSNQLLIDAETGSIYIYQQINNNQENPFILLTKISIHQLIENINILSNNQNSSIILFDKNLNVLYKTSRQINFSDNLDIIKYFLSSKQQSSSFTNNRKNQSSQLNLRKVTNIPLNIALFNENHERFTTWKNNTVVYILVCVLMLGLLLQILYSLIRAKRLNQALFLKESKLSASETRFRQMIEAMPIGLILARAQDKLIIYINKPAAQILDMPQASALSKRVFEIYADRDSFTSQISAISISSTSQSLECILIRNTGESFWANVSMSLVDVAETQTLLIGIADISAQKRLEAELKHQATTDHLSGLYNRAHFINSSNKEIQRIQRLKKNASLMMLDIDHFKRVNDNFGHDAGDLVIQIIALTCQEILRDIDLLGRLGGEEFAALLPETSVEEALKVAERLRATIENRQIKLKNGQIINITSSIGVTEVTHQDEMIDFALKRADLALYSSKNNGRNRVTNFDSSLE
ncbi:MULTISPECIES: GGDEF domain-containing protein [Deefgea]|uniref:diguanylate cyclase n=1 Tax=Deefgea chitinilytica TaxID=570276 RepID=A0ABS2CB34_9NEIS|nr:MULTISPECIES: sensor domain-containing diguanylate cyclase [Deefgea]MBM5571363.1 diguanylate cyclase [Deefgea chitinilytica]MBM9888596.1 GGDEF domain-containing protein [Deefgea sp. CFH1-16]